MRGRHLIGAGTTCEEEDDGPGECKVHPQPDRLLTAGDGLWREIFVLLFHWMVDGQVSIEWVN